MTAGNPNHFTHQPSSGLFPCQLPEVYFYGVALITGFRKACQTAADVMVSIDGDGHILYEEQAKVAPANLSEPRSASPSHFRHHIYQSE